MKNRKITGGLYLVLDPSMERSLLLQRLKEALEGGVELLQIWNNWLPGFDRNKKKHLIKEVAEVAKDYPVPILINEEWELLRDSPLSGVHFDRIPENFALIRQKLPKDSIVGVTCGNDLRIVEWADNEGLDYVSFCALFPSRSVDSCEIVSRETLQKAGSLIRLPLFVSGGITPQNILQLKGMNISGVAVISGILNQSMAKEAAYTLNNALKQLENEKFTAK